MTPVKTRLLQRYRCAYCKRTATKQAMERHEEQCYWNSKRYCRQCHNGSEYQGCTYCRKCEDVRKSVIENVFRGGDLYIADCHRSFLTATGVLNKLAELSNDSQSWRQAFMPIPEDIMSQYNAIYNDALNLWEA